MNTETEWRDGLDELASHYERVLEKILNATDYRKLRYE